MVSIVDGNGIMVRAQWYHGTCPKEDANLFVPSMLPNQRCSGSASGGAYLDFPRSREQEAAVGHYGALFTASGIRPHGITYFDQLSGGST